MDLETPYYLIDEQKILKNLQIIARVKLLSGVKVVLALKCFAVGSVFELMRKYLDGTTSSSLYEVRLGREKFKKEVHAYSVAFAPEEIKEVKKYADKVIFNSLSQLEMYYRNLKPLKLGLRVNPGVSFSPFALADPGRKYCRLGITDKKSIAKVLPRLSGLMFHFNCENDNFQNLSANIDVISKNYGDLLEKVEWVSLGGGIYFTQSGYPVEKLAQKLKQFSQRHKVQVYLEPGEAVITRSAELVTKVVDIVHNELDIAIIDASTEAHMLDLLLYQINAKIQSSGSSRYKYMIAGRSCLAGDIFGTYRFKSRLKVGDIIKISDAAGYTMVKKNWFNGLKMPAIVVKRLDGSIKVIRSFGYKDYLNSLS